MRNKRVYAGLRPGLVTNFILCKFLVPAPSMAANCDIPPLLTRGPRTSVIFSHHFISNCMECLFRQRSHEKNDLLASALLQRVHGNRDRLLFITGCPNFALFIWSNELQRLICGERTADKIQNYKE